MKPASSVSDSRSRDFVRELCIALAHRWEPERLFVILTSYFDESGTHGGSPTTVMAGIMGNARQWSRFQNTLDELKARYGFTVFHAKDFRAGAGEFRGWSPQKCMGLIRELGSAGSGLMEAVTCVLPNSDYDQYYRNGDQPRRLRLDTRYGLCFRYLLTHLLIETGQRLGHHKKFAETKMHVVLEAGHKNSGDATRIFSEMRKELVGLNWPVLSTITLAGKNEGDALMMADYLAHGTLKLEEAGLNGPGDTEYTGPRPKETGMTHLQFDADGLATLKAQLITGFKNGGGWKATFLEPSPLSARQAQMAAEQPE